MISPRSVTGASTRHSSGPSVSERRESGAIDLHLLGAHRLLGRPAVEGDHRRRLLDGAPLVRPERLLAAPSAVSSRMCARRTSARPERSAMRKETCVASSARPSSRVTASTASTGEAASAASSTLP